MCSRSRANLLALLVGLLALGWIGYRAATATDRVTWRVRFDHRPADDAPLADWLRAQPGVSDVTVGRAGAEVAVGYRRPLFGSNELLDVPGQMTSFGYAGFRGFTTRIDGGFSLP